MHKEVVNELDYRDNNEASSRKIKTNFPSKPDTPGKMKLRSWLNKNMKIEMTDGRVLIGIFLCTDRNCNIILGSCSEYLKPEDGGSMEEPRVLGLVMVPGRHTVSINLDDISEGK
ncbi:N-alpha-acetyltransferase 38-A, NatC auxiliary subunit [Ischnura elegans]|uniref:N-alpha-acetyltransferase 38-A, NatC auxiliary subunit n=1 Tax=Ischnura elegans TaxID=197161 RepID=UPI001ED8917F|nr:N-alpha-acetyltransferase 38-A, NatC auxiliary subunit [Ischnura elegans]